MERQRNKRFGKRKRRLRPISEEKNQRNAQKPNQRDQRASADFLAALEAQRKNEEERQKLQKPQQKEQKREETKSLKGFYFDPTKGKFFKKSTSNSKGSSNSISTTEKQQKLPPPPPPPLLLRRRDTLAWPLYFRIRESSFHWSARQQDQRTLMSQMFQSQRIRVVSIERPPQLSAFRLCDADLVFSEETKSIFAAVACEFYYFRKLDCVCNDILLL